MSSFLTFADARAEAGAIAPRLIYPDGRLQPSVCSFPTPVALLSAGSGLDKLFPGGPTEGLSSPPLIHPPPCRRNVLFLRVAPMAHKLIEGQIQRRRSAGRILR